MHLKAQCCVFTNAIGRLLQVATGSAHVYFTPQDAHLTIENKASS